jgi:MOSC domain-containing protein YiiM
MPELTGKIVAVCISPQRGMRKSPVEQAEMVANHGIKGDAHAGPGHRQVSLLTVASIEQIRGKGIDTFPGIFAENLVVEGLELMTLPVKTVLAAGRALLEVTQIGKECHSRCAIYDQAGDCVMPREGIFAKVLDGGVVKPGDRIEVLRPSCPNCACGLEPC